MTSGELTQLRAPLSKARSRGLVMPPIRTLIGRANMATEVRSLALPRGPASCSFPFGAGPLDAGLQQCLRLPGGPIHAQPSVPRGRGVELGTLGWGSIPGRPPEPRVPGPDKRMSWPARARLEVPLLGIDSRSRRLSLSCCWVRGVPRGD